LFQASLNVYVAVERTAAVVHVKIISAGQFFVDCVCKSFRFRC